MAVSNSNLSLTQLYTNATNLQLVLHTLLVGQTISLMTRNAVVYKYIETDVFNDLIPTLITALTSGFSFAINSKSSSI